MLNPRRRSLLRGNILVVSSFAASFWLSDFPRSRATPFLLVPVFLAFCGTFDTLRCMQPRRDLYHAGIILCLFMDVLAVCLILFFLFFPYVF